MACAQGKGNIFTTDLALAVLMAAPRSVVSWDILVQKTGGCLYLGSCARDAGMGLGVCARGHGEGARIGSENIVLKSDGRAYRV